jgi:imidazoleglycerol-phosphate dehydratase
MAERQGRVVRETLETQILIELSLDGSGQFDIRTGNGMLDHLLAQLARHGRFDLKIQAQGDLETGWHHLIEDVGISLGRALREAVGEATGIRRMGHAIVPLDETLAQVAVDFSGRGYAVVETGLSEQPLETLPPDLIQHLLESMAVEGKLTLHAKILAGRNDHHKAEALFKALARALADAVEVDPRLGGQVPSTKGSVV